jgi:glycosyltransferase involved in cell wall biosynthesis
MRQGDSQSRVSVVIPCFNLGAFVAEAVDSVLRQTWGRPELVVVDDGSTDERTVAELDRLRGDGVHVLRTENAGPGAARNRGIEETRGEYLLCLDADDVLLPPFLERTVPKLDEQPEAGIVAADVQIFGRRWGVWRVLDFDPVRMLWRNPLPTTSLFRRVCWEEVGGYPEERAVQSAEDWGFWIAIVGRGWRWVPVNEVLHRYRMRADSLSSHRLTSRAEIFRELIRLNEELYRDRFPEIVVDIDGALRAREMSGARAWARRLVRRL